MECLKLDKACGFCISKSKTAKTHVFIFTQSMDNFQREFCQDDIRPQSQT